MYEKHGKNFYIVLKIGCISHHYSSLSCLAVPEGCVEISWFL